MSIKNPEVEALAKELSRLTKSSKTEVIRQALLEKKERLGKADPAEHLAERNRRVMALLETRIWPNVKKGGSRRWSKKEEEAFLGYGKNGEPV
jgi:hypothetical protein